MEALRDSLRKKMVTMDALYHSTRDLDFLACVSGDDKSIRIVIDSVCAQSCPEDGLRFDVASLAAE
jgi:hypothetical protein